MPPTDNEPASVFAELQRLSNLQASMNPGIAVSRNALEAALAAQATAETSHNNRQFENFINPSGVTWQTREADAYRIRQQQDAMQAQQFAQQWGNAAGEVAEAQRRANRQRREFTNEYQNTRSIAEMEAADRRRLTELCESGRISLHDGFQFQFDRLVQPQTCRVSAVAYRDGPWCLFYHVDSDRWRSEGGQIWEYREDGREFVRVARQPQRLAQAIDMYEELVVNNGSPEATTFNDERLAQLITQMNDGGWPPAPPQPALPPPAPVNNGPAATVERGKRRIIRRDQEE